MEKLNFALLPDGTSDCSLLPVLKWLLRKSLNQIPINGQWADLSRFSLRHNSLVERIQYAIYLYNPDLLFIHRDAEKQKPQKRYQEIDSAIKEIIKNKPECGLPHICVVPIRMTEAWLLFDKYAIRKAVGNPNGRVDLDLPPLNRLETIADPKKMLFEILIRASELHGRYRKKFKPSRCRRLISENISDFSPLLKLNAFKKLSDDIKKFAESC